LGAPLLCFSRVRVLTFFSAAIPLVRVSTLVPHNEFLSPLFPQCCALSPLYPLCFAIVHRNWRAKGVTPVTAVPSRIGMGGGASIRQEERSLRPDETYGAQNSRCAARRAIIRRERRNRAAPVPSTPLRAGGMTEGRKDKRNSRTGLKTGHYIRKRGGGHDPDGSRDRCVGPFGRESRRDDGGERRGEKV
jgi:hypothetical protein